MLPELREEQPRHPPRPGRVEGAGPAPRGGSTSNCWHLRLRMLTSLAWRGATFCFTWMASFLVFVHCSGSSYGTVRRGLSLCRS